MAVLKAWAALSCFSFQTSLLDATHSRWLNLLFFNDAQIPLIGAVLLWLTLAFTFDARLRSRHPEDYRAMGFWNNGHRLFRSSWNVLVFLYTGQFLKRQDKILTGLCLAMALVLPYTLFLFFNTPGGPAVSYSSPAAENMESIPSNPTQPQEQVMTLVLVVFWIFFIAIVIWNGSIRLIKRRLKRVSPKHYSELGPPEPALGPMAHAFGLFRFVCKRQFQDIHDGGLQILGWAAYVSFVVCSVSICFLTGLFIWFRIHPILS